MSMFPELKRSIESTLLLKSTVGLSLMTMQSCLLLLIKFELHSFMMKSIKSLPENLLPVLMLCHQHKQVWQPTPSGLLVHHQQSSTNRSVETETTGTEEAMIRQCKRIVTRLAGKHYKEHHFVANVRMLVCLCYPSKYGYKSPTFHQHKYEANP